MRVGFLGASSNIARDLLHSFSIDQKNKLFLFTRNPDHLKKWLLENNIHSGFELCSYRQLETQFDLDLLINFIGAGNPTLALNLENKIFGITEKYDEIALDYIKKKPWCKYIYLSSGAVFCSGFNQPIDDSTKASIDLNNLRPNNWYSASKLCAEIRHRSLEKLFIVDLRIFNYFSHRQDMSSSFLLPEIVKAIRDKKTLVTNSENIIRDFISPIDFFQIILKVISQEHLNTAFDCYSKKPISKFDLLNEVSKRYGLSYVVDDLLTHDNNVTGIKPYYYSLSKKANQFGYEPIHSSISGLCKELDILFAN
jgi:dTDP-4-dehydrorhamnose reductase